MIDLNPPGRLQNRKVRPTVRLTDNLRGWLLHWRLAKPITYGGVPVKGILPKTFKKIAVRAIWLGHTDPDYRENCATATDAIMVALDKPTQRSMIAPGSIQGSRLSVIEGGEVEEPKAVRGGS